MHVFISRFLDDDAGATAIEYGLIAAIMAVAIIAAMSTLGGSFGSAMNNMGNRMNVS